MPFQRALNRDLIEIISQFTAIYASTADYFGKIKAFYKFK